MVRDIIAVIAEKHATVLSSLGTRLLNILKSQNDRQTPGDLVEARKALRPQKQTSVTQTYRRPYDDTTETAERLKQWQMTLDRLQQPGSLPMR